MRSGSRTLRSEPSSFSRDGRGKSELFSKDRRGKSADKKDFVSNKDLLEEIKKIKLDVAELKKKTVNFALVEKEEIEVKNVFFTEQNTRANTMILDLGAPCSLVG